MSFLSNIGQQLVYIYDQRAQAVYAAAQQVASSVRNASLVATAKTAAQFGTTVSPPVKRTFTLALYQASQTTMTGPTDAVTIGNVKTSLSTKPISMITFDVFVSPNVNGFAQRISYEKRARQSVQQSLAGFNVVEFGTAPGTLDIEAIVTWTTTPGAQVQQFFDQLEVAKMSAPNSTDSPYQLKFLDTFTQKSFLITQEGVSLTQDAENPNRGILKINATILLDYSSPIAPMKQQPIDTTLAAAQAAAQAALTSLTTANTATNS